MRVLADSHTLIWALDDPNRLSATARTVLSTRSNDLIVSAATIWEIAIKIGSGKLRLSLPYRDWMSRAVADLALTILPITVDYAERQSTLPNHHRDPFDRLLIAQSLVDSIPIVSNEVQFDAYHIQRIW